KRTEKTKSLVENGVLKSATPPEATPTTPRRDAGLSEGGPEQGPAEQAERARPVAKGHGRNGADAYRGAERSDVPHPSLKAGAACPACGEGIVYARAPGVRVGIGGQPPLTAKIYALQKLRCPLCGEVFTAEPPAEAGERKYDATAGSMIGLLKYGSGMPFHRLDGLQEHLEISLPASTRWDLVNAGATNLAPAFDGLITQAGQGGLVH